MEPPPVRFLSSPRRLEDTQRKATIFLALFPGAYEGLSEANGIGIRKRPAPRIGSR
jgi:hypothetical protein